MGDTISQAGCGGRLKVVTGAQTTAGPASRVAGVLRERAGAAPDVSRSVEGAGAGAGADRAAPGMRVHLAGRPACPEDHASHAEFAADAASRPPAA